LQKQNYTVKMARKRVAMPTTVTVQPIVSQRQRKREMSTTLVFVCTGHWNFWQMTKRFRSGLIQNVLCSLVQF